MTEYEQLMNKSDYCCKKAIEFANKGDWNMATFWKNASIGFKEKALNSENKMDEKISNNFCIVK